eukprot:gb/GECG01003857.1/.p1 GENE.gb/GECG01003857.1/~~gb/GECG01003857.1/.p1  ORF type:complete len:264 (+),score=54.16 gb/GECG01003857.1/:1-792(+)
MPSKKQQKQDNEVAKNADTYLQRIEHLLDNFSKLNRKAEKAIHEAEKKKSRTGDPQFAEFVKEAEQLKTDYLSYKQSLKEDMERIESEDIKKSKRDKLRQLQERYRSNREEYKTLGVEDYVRETDRDELMKEAREQAAQEQPKPGQSKNDYLLNQATGTAKKTTEQLREGLHDVNQAKATADQVAVTLQEDREMIQNISRNVDEIESDLAISQKLLTRFIKRLYTDKIVIGFTCLIVCALAAIIAYVAVEGNGSLGSNPDTPQ